MDEQDVRVEIFMNALPFKVMYSIHTHRQYSSSVAYSMSFKFNTLQLAIRYMTPEEFFLYLAKMSHLPYLLCISSIFNILSVLICTLQAYIDIILTFDS